MTDIVKILVLMVGMASLILAIIAIVMIKIAHTLMDIRALLKDPKIVLNIDDLQVPPQLHGQLTHIAWEAGQNFHGAAKR